MRTTAGTALLACAVLLQTGVQGCTGDGSDSPDAASSSSSPATSSPADETTTDAADKSSISSRPSADPTNARCRARERGIATDTAFRLQRAIDDLMRSTDRVSESAATKVRDRAERARQAVRTQCTRPSAAMRSFLRTAERRAGGPLSHADLDAVMHAYAGWTRHVGVPKQADQLRQALQGCRALRRDAHASYRVWWRWADAGREWWIELTFRNDLPRALFATLSGRVRVTHLAREDAQGGREVSPRPVSLDWGGSSLDYAEIPRGLSQHLVAPAAGNYVATGVNGRFDVQEVAVSVDVPGTRAWWCHLPVPERA